MPMCHDSEVAAIAYAIQKIIKSATKLKKILMQLLTILCFISPQHTKWHVKNAKSVVHTQSLRKTDASFVPSVDTLERVASTC